jgi:hypothetical protein
MLYSVGLLYCLLNCIIGTILGWSALTKLMVRF